MAVKISTQKSKDILTRIIRDRFDDINLRDNEAHELILVARFYELYDLAEEMQSDLECYNRKIKQMVDAVLEPIDEILASFLKSN